MSRKSRYSTEFKQDAVSRMGQGGKTVTALAEELGVRRKFLYLWRERLQAGGKSALERGPGKPPGSKSKSISFNGSAIRANTLRLSTAIKGTVAQDDEQVDL